MRVIKYAVAIALVATSSAFAAFNEVEPNGTAATASGAPVPCIGSNIGFGSLAAGGGDIDYYSVVVPGGCYLTAITTPYGTFGEAPDTSLAIMSPADALIVENNDAGTDGVGAGPTPTGDWGSAIRYFNGGATATYYLRVRPDPTGTGTTGPYALTVSLFPEPSTLALLGLGALALIRRRK